MINPLTYCLVIEVRRLPEYSAVPSVFTKLKLAFLGSLLIPFSNAIDELWVFFADRDLFRRQARYSATDQVGSNSSDWRNNTVRMASVKRLIELLCINKAEEQEMTPTYNNFEFASIRFCANTVSSKRLISDTACWLCIFPSSALFFLWSRWDRVTIINPLIG